MKQSKRVYRNSYDKVIAGVAGGLAHYFNVDPIIIRLLFVALAFAGAGGIIVYIILWIALPFNPDHDYYTFYNNQNPEDNQDEKTKNQDDTKSDEAEILDSNISARPFENTGKRDSKKEGNLIVGIFLIVLGLIFLIVRFIPDLYIRHFWPLILVIIGFVFIYNALSKPKHQ